MKICDQMPEIRIVELYDTGVVKLYECGGVQFGWQDWVLCDIMNESSNPPHRVICTTFWQNKHNKLGLVTGLTFSLWSSSYDTEHNEDCRLSSFYYWCPIMMIDRYSNKNWEDMQTA